MGIDAGTRRASFPEAPGPPKDQTAYLQFVDDIYKSDAYHSLSIEGYSVTPELIERVRAATGTWSVTMTTARTATPSQRAATGKLSRR